MKKTILLSIGLTLFFLSNSLAQNSTRPEISKYCKVYLDNENLQITMLRIGKPENNEVLLEILGIDHPMDKKIFKAKVIETDRSSDYMIQYEGKDWTIATKRSDGYNNDTTIIYLPMKGKKPAEFRIQYSKELSNQCNPEFLLTAFLSQK